MKKLFFTLFTQLIVSVVMSASLTKEQTESLNEKIKEYDYVGNFSENRALVTKNNKSGFINKTGEVVIPLQYENVSNSARGFRNGLWVHESAGVIDSMGNRVVPEGKVIRISRVPYDGHPIWMINQFPDFKPVDIIQIETEVGKKVSYCFEYGKLLFSMNNDMPVVNSLTGEFLSITKKGGKTYLGEEDLKKQGFQELRWPSDILYRVIESQGDGGKCLIMKKDNKYGIVDMNFQEVYPFISDNSFFDYIDGTVLLHKYFYKEGGEFGLESYPISASIWRNGKILADNLYDSPNVYGKYIFFNGQIGCDGLTGLEKYLNIKLPESTKNTKMYTTKGKEITPIVIPVGKNRLSFIGNRLWMFEDAKGNAIYPIEIEYYGKSVILGRNGNDVYYETLIDIATGDTAIFPVYYVEAYFDYLDYGILKLSELKYDSNCFPLAPYIVTSSKEDNKLNVKFLKRRGEDTDVCKIKNTETNKLIEKDFQQVESFSDGLLRVKFNDRWYFLNDKGEGIK